MLPSGEGVNTNVKLPVINGKCLMQKWKGRTKKSMENSLTEYLLFSVHIVLS
jgi:hypothetical protein